MPLVIPHTNARTHARAHCTCARTHARTHVRTHARTPRTHARMHAHMHARTHACTHARTHAYTHSRSGNPRAEQCVVVCCSAVQVCLLARLDSRMSPACLQKNSICSQKSLYDVLANLQRKRRNIGQFFFTCVCGVCKRMYYI